ncbi:hypothetical protein B7486_75465 [cyanobacterium TDX16]|nr:hypothetical protein B7486_75465 [cyanobacterium TDX16]
MDRRLRVARVLLARIDAVPGKGWNAGIQDEHRWWARLAQSALLGLAFSLSTPSVRSGLPVALTFVLLTEAFYWAVQGWRRWRRSRRGSIAA